ncbi:unnamed protein product [Rotaria magnacalcarata]
MWYPPEQQQQQRSCYEYAQHFSSQQQTYPRTQYYFNGDELSITNVFPINDENESPLHCQTTYSGSTHVITDCYVTASTNLYGDEMPSFHMTPTRNAYWDPIITAPTKLFVETKPMSISAQHSHVVSSSSPSSPSPSPLSSCWDWVLFSPDYYSEFYTPLSSSTYHQQEKLEEENDDDININFLASLPTCLLALLCLTPKLLNKSDDENDNDQEISSLRITDEPLLSSLSNNINEKRNNISSNRSLSSANKNSSNLNINKQNLKDDRSSTPDTDDGYQSASDASRSDYSQQSSRRDQHHSSNHDITIIKHSLPTTLMPRRISYAAAVKPNTMSTSKISSSQMMIIKPKQIFNNTQSTIANDILNKKGQKSKFIAPRFERMHSAKQYTSSSVSTNRTQIRSNNSNNNNNNNNQRNHIVNSIRRF